MKKLLLMLVAVVALALSITSNVRAQVPLDMTPHAYGAPAWFYQPMYINGAWYIGGTAVTTTAAQLNGIVSNTVSLYSNANLQVYMSNIVVVAGGGFTIPASFVISNSTLKVYLTNVQVVAGGSLTVGTGGSVTLPAASITPSALIGGKSGVFTNGIGGASTTTVWTSSGIITNWVTVP